MSSTASSPAPEIVWTGGGVPVAAAFDDPYYSREDGRAETTHVFLSGNGLPGRFSVGGVFRVGELGFGTGLNFLETWRAWEAAGSPGRLCYTGFERFPMGRADLERALSPWPDLFARAAPIFAVWPPAMDVALKPAPGLDLTLIVGDANERLAGWAERADAWYLDGFAPSKNPELWNETLLGEVGHHTAPSGTFATYTVAGSVRRALAAAGFSLEKRAGFGRKREMLCGQII